MPHRTYLTAPPGTEPSEATGRAADEARERYVPGLSAATEPAVRSRWRRPLLVATTLLVLGGAGYVAVLVTVDGQAEDPSLLVPAPADRADQAATDG